MKKYVSCFLFFLCLTTGCLLTLFFLTIGTEDEEAREVQVTESVEQPAFARHEEETKPLTHVVLNQEEVVPELAAENYCLVAEEGYLIVYDSDKETVNMFTHMPLSDFPVSEQEKLMEGIWFPTMNEIFSYLESYTS